jgi:hypothetical protein
MRSSSGFPWSRAGPARITGSTLGKWIYGHSCRFRKNLIASSTLTTYGLRLVRRGFGAVRCLGDKGTRQHRAKISESVAASLPYPFRDSARYGCLCSTSRSAPTSANWRVPIPCRISVKCCPDPSDIRGLCLANSNSDCRRSDSRRGSRLGASNSQCKDIDESLPAIAPLASLSIV